MANVLLLLSAHGPMRMCTKLGEGEDSDYAAMEGCNRRAGRCSGLWQDAFRPAIGETSLHCARRGFTALPESRITQLIGSPNFRRRLDHLRIRRCCVLPVDEGSLDVRNAVQNQHSDRSDILPIQQPVPFHRSRSANVSQSRQRGAQ